MYTVNLDTAEFTQVGDSNIGGTRTNYGVATLACDLDGNLYCVERGSQMAEFYKLELVDNRPVCKKIGNTGCPSDFSRIQSMTFDRNTGDLYWQTALYMALHSRMIG